MDEQLTDEELSDTDGELMEEGDSEEDELIEPVLGDKGASNQEMSISSSEKQEEQQHPVTFWTGPTTRARAKAHQEVIQHLAKLVRPKEEGETVGKEGPACWFNVFQLCN